MDQIYYSKNMPTYKFKPVYGSTILKEMNTTQTKYTQGGWNRNIKPASKYNTIYAGRNTHVARVATEGLSEEEIEANCNLIAAAPELLEALKAVVSTNDYCDFQGRLSFEFKEALALVVSAIAKAEGRME